MKKEKDFPADLECMKYFTQMDKDCWPCICMVFPRNEMEHQGNAIDSCENILILFIQFKLTKYDDKPFFMLLQIGASFFIKDLRHLIFSFLSNFFSDTIFVWIN
jgi:hypothetical protein